MCEMESPLKATTPPSLSSSPPPPPKTPLSSTCYHCKKNGHFAKFCPAKNPNKSQPPQHPTIYCSVCRGSCVVLVSKTARNPGRSFCKCPAGCDFFKWCDEVTQDNLKLDTQSTFPQCPCGAGRCQKLTKTNGPNAGLSYFTCPIKSGHGSCQYILWEWENTQVNTSVGQHVQESKGSGSPQSTCDSHREFDLRKIDNSSLERSEMSEFEVPEMENPQGFARSNVLSPNQDDSSRCVVHGNGISTLESAMGDLVLQEVGTSNCMTKKKVSRIISFMSKTEVHCRQIEFWRQISAAKDISLKGIFPNFDHISVPQDGIILNLRSSTPLVDHPCAGLDKLSSPTPGADNQLLNGILWKPSGLKRSFATLQSDILISSFSESLERTATPIQSLDQAAVQLQKTLEQTVLNFQNEFVSILNTIDPSDHNTMTMVANKYFSYIDHLQLPIDCTTFFSRVKEYIESASKLAGIEQSVLKEHSLEELTEHYSSEKKQFDNISKVHDEAVAALASSSGRQQTLQEEASRLRAMLLQIESQLSCCEAEMSEYKTRVDMTAKDMLDSKNCVEKAEETLKLHEQREEERRQAKTAFEQISCSLKRVCGLHMKKRRKL